MRDRRIQAAATKPARVDLSRSAVARYIQLASLFRRRIQSGQWSVGAQIPTVEDLAAECGVARATIRQALGQLETEDLIERYRAKGTFVKAHANAFLERLGDPGDSQFAQLAGSLSSDTGLRARSSFYFNELIHIAQPASPFRLLLDIALGLLGVRSAFERSAHRFLARLLYLNSARVQNDVEDRVVESRRLLESEIRALLAEVRTGAASALASARETRNAGVHAVETALTQLDAMERQIRDASAA